MHMPVMPHLKHIRHFGLSYPNDQYVLKLNLIQQLKKLAIEPTKSTEQLLVLVSPYLALCLQIVDYYCKPYQAI